MEHIRTWIDPDNCGFRLELYDPNERDSYGKAVLAYEFYHDDTLIYQNEDFHCSPLHGTDSDETVTSLLQFLSLRPGDMDPDYFNDYSPEQLAWCMEHGEQLSQYVEMLENPVRYYRHRQSGDYLAIQPNRWHRLSDGTRVYEGRSNAIVGLLSSMCSCSISDVHRQECDPVEEEDVPEEWHQAIGLRERGNQMGYSHHWHGPRRVSAGKFSAIAWHCRRVVEHIGVPVQLEDNDAMPPIFTSKEIRFNGVGEAGHETCIIGRDYLSSFCKTDRKPYDAAVCACLIVLRAHLGEKFIVTSSGDDDEEGWPIARKACQEVLKRGGDFSLLTAGYERFNRRGLKYKREASQFFRKCYRLSNDWLMFRVGAKVKVFKRYSADSYIENQPIASASNLPTAAWLATILEIEETLRHEARTGKPDFPMEPFLENAKETPHDWTALAILADAMEDKDDRRFMVLRALLPREV
jgi:hypothetical protein